MDRKINEYFQVLLKEVPELMDYINSARASDNYGCGHEAYWKGIADPEIPDLNFPNARWQEIAYSFSLLYHFNDESNVYYHKRILLDHIKGLFKFWLLIQHSDGSFDEWRKEEHGQPPTAFSLFAMSRTYLQCSQYFEQTEKENILAAFKKAALFLSKNEELVATNHEVASVAALYSAYLIFKEEDNHFSNYVQTSIAKKLIKISNNFIAEEGWLKEIAGPDTGYNTISLAFLAIYWELSSDSQVLGILEKIVKFNSLFTYPDGLTGGGTNSRYSYLNCPLAFAITKDVVPNSRLLLSHYFKYIDRFIVNGRYKMPKYHKGVMFYLYLLSVIKSSGFTIEDKSNYALPGKSEVLNQAHILIHNNLKVYATVGWGASLGVLFLKGRNRNIVFSSPLGWINQGGIVAELVDGKTLTSTYKGNKVSNEITENTYMCTGSMLPFSQTSETVWEIRNDFKFKTRLFRILKKAPVLLRYGRIIWFILIKPVKEKIKFFRANKYEFCRGMVFTSAGLSLNNGLKIPKNMIRNVYMQELLYSPSLETSFSFAGSNPLIIENGQLSFVSDILQVNDNSTKKNIMSFSFDTPVNIIIELLAVDRSANIIQHASGYIVKLKFIPVFDETVVEYKLNYRIVLGE